MQQLAIKASPHVSWRRAAIGGIVAVSGFVLLIGGYMVLRAMGIGPAGSLLAAGALEKDEKILVADLTSSSGDTTLGPVVTDAFRTALGQSQSVNVVQAATVRDVLRRMERPVDTPVDFALAREIATREGIKAVIDGSLVGVGGRYVLALRLLSAQTGDPLATFRETANTQSEILPAVDRLAKEVRARIGESLRNVQSAPPLEQVTTPSLDALKKYVQGVRTVGEGDFSRGVALLEEAVAIDTGFAMAYRKLGVEYGNRGFREKAGEYYDKAYAHVDRLSDAERYLMLGSYYQLSRRQDAAKSMAAYERLLEIQPNNTAGLNNLSSQLMYLHQHARAESLLVRAIAVGPVATVHYRNLARARFALGQVDSTRAAALACAKAFPNNVDCQAVTGFLLWAIGRRDSAAATWVGLENRISDPETRSEYLLGKSDVARTRGRLAEAWRLMDEAIALKRQAGTVGWSVLRDATVASDRAWFFGDGAGALRMLDESLGRTPLRSLPTSEAPYSRVVAAYAYAGHADRAKAVLAEWEMQRREHPTTQDSARASRMRGRVALAAGDYEAARAHFRVEERIGCSVCELALLARTYDLADARDSAIVIYERYLGTRFLDRLEADAEFLAVVHKRLGELYEAKGQRDRALEHYRAFIELWKDADPELQPKVTDARQRVAALTRGTDVRR
jgi:tetratricopeptide (TPR) repeat protein